MQIIETVDHPLHFVLLPERRSLESELELAADTLGNAIHYLLSQRQIHRDAIEILCQAGHRIAHQERRRAARKAIASCLRAAA